ncbi:hypothetical protein LEP1GSC132_3116 [Leptospira kirschneri str. 200803703]|uniref:Transposase n=1 Tax=Leptospira kirschneri str. 200802841 TaxID=1193047 RepID=A0A828Y0K9_9LEPT|nr:hypothetical protein LEP1GSC131_0493 [Leptospira kirschneri str. 200802841]EMO67538.1 hypothetical protein LEP1GSC132_3116 [Leptospira kirschneri str. 200803703]EMO74683.1 hypothetical protein LEP1GSC127_0206 [Leptospira kirschneri str. 200801925]
MRTIKRYSDTFKRKVIEEIREVAIQTITRPMKNYGIKGSVTIRSLLKKYGKNHLMSKIVSGNEK